MEGINIAIESSQEIAAKRLAFYLSDQKQKYIARLYDRFHSETSEWFVLTLKSEQPAFQHGKYSLVQSGGGFRASFYIEKGFNIPLEIVKASTTVKRNQVINDDWQWRSFMEDINDEVLELDDDWSIEIGFYQYGQQEAEKKTFRGSMLREVAEEYAKSQYYYYWIDMYIYPDTDEQDVEKLYDSFLCKFIRWVK